MNPTHVAAYIALFVATGLAFVFVNLLVGRFVRPHNPHPEKGEIYECGEPTIGSSFVQFDLRFYVVALLFLIFDLEIAFFFPWATVFGKATNLQDPAIVASEGGAEMAAGTFREWGVAASAMPEANAQLAEKAAALAWFSFYDILVFFAVVLVGFAYVWMRGDIDWVRAVGRPRAERPPSPSAPREPAGETVAV